MLPAIARSEYSIVVKIFACLKTLSSRAVAEKLVAPGHRSLAFHFAEFNKVSPFFDFVDTGDEGHVPTKITGKTSLLYLMSSADGLISENLRWHMAIEHCKHVFFCAAGSPKYHIALKPYHGQTKRVTIVTGSIADVEICTLGLHMISFARVFKVGPLNATSNTTAIKPASIEVTVRQITPRLRQVSP